jgi:hypothetical protein
MHRVTRRLRVAIPLCMQDKYHKISTGKHNSCIFSIAWSTFRMYSVMAIFKTSAVLELFEYTGTFFIALYIYIFYLKRKEQDVISQRTLILPVLKQGTGLIMVKTK